jgi:hypothetical protein
MIIMMPPQANDTEDFPRRIHVFSGDKVLKAASALGGPTPAKSSHLFPPRRLDGATNVKMMLF